MKQIFFVVSVGIVSLHASEYEVVKKQLDEQVAQAALDQSSKKQIERASKKVENASTVGDLVFIADQVVSMAQSMPQLVPTVKNLFISRFVMLAQNEAIDKEVVPQVRRFLVTNQHFSLEQRNRMIAAFNANPFIKGDCNTPVRMLSAPSDLPDPEPARVSFDATRNTVVTIPQASKKKLLEEIASATTLEAMQDIHGKIMGMQRKEKHQKELIAVFKKRVEELCASGRLSKVRCRVLQIEAEQLK